MFPMEIPRALAKLGDRRAIPHLIETIEQPADAQGHDSDSSDDYWMLGLSSAPVVECCLALSKFFGLRTTLVLLLFSIVPCR